MLQRYVGALPEAEVGSVAVEYVRQFERRPPAPSGWHGSRSAERFTQAKETPGPVETTQGAERRKSRHAHLAHTGSAEGHRPGGARQRSPQPELDPRPDQRGDPSPRRDAGVPA